MYNRETLIGRLVGGLNPSEKYEFVNWDDELPNIWENKKCSKPPTREVMCRSHDVPETTHHDMLRGDQTLFLHPRGAESSPWNLTTWSSKPRRDSDPPSSRTLKSKYFLFVLRLYRYSFQDASRNLVVRPIQLVSTAKCAIVIVSNFFKFQDMPLVLSGQAANSPWKRAAFSV